MFSAARMSLKLLLAAALLVLSACPETEVPGGEITIRNDILDNEYNEIVIDQVLTGRGAAAFQRKISPREQVTLPFKEVTSIRLRRHYADHSMVYHVSCPREMNRRISFRLIDVHTNRLPGGCVLTRRGRTGRGGRTVWD